jgi:uncharacterized membrane protein YhaH (DUF805 family)
MSYYLKCLRSYAVFSGRARPAEYWMFALGNFLLAIVLFALDVALGTATEDGGLLGSVYALAILLPSLAVTTRRLHDTGRSGWWFLLALAPCIGAIILMVFLAQDSQRGANAYGEDPRAAG